MTILGLLLALAGIGDLSGHSFWAQIAQLASQIVYLSLCWGILTGRLPPISPAGLAAFALLFRLAVLPALPSLSGDVHRYRWEGRVRAEGGNPYLSRPQDEALRHLRDATHPRISSHHALSGYGPLWTEIEHRMYRLAAWLTGDAWRQVWLFKLPAILGDLALLWLLARLLRIEGLPAARWAIYAWCPTPVVEFWHSGHNDSCMLAFLVLALLLAKRRSWVGAFAALAGSALIKIWPAALFPLFILNPAGRQERPRWWQWLVAAPLAAPFFWLYWAPVSENVDFMGGFLGGWRNNDSLFAVLLWAAGPLKAKYAVAGCLCAALAILVLRRVELSKAIAIFITVMLLISANVHPWYLTWVLPWLALMPFLPLFVWVGLMPLSYQVLAAWHESGVWAGSTPRRWWIYVPVLSTLAYSLWQRAKLKA